MNIANSIANSIVRGIARSIARGIAKGIVNGIANGKLKFVVVPSTRYKALIRGFDAATVS